MKSRAPDPDLVDRIFAYLRELDPSLSKRKLERIRDLVRAEFAGERCYVTTKSAAERMREKQEVLSRFNGRNATTIARELGISRAQVYRHLKQARQARRLNFAGNETPKRLRSAESTALRRRQGKSDQWPSRKKTSTPSTLPLPVASSPSPATGAPSPTAASTS